MQPSQLPVYRSTERLMNWSIPFVERLPKSLPYQTLGGLLIRDIRECMDAITMAFQSAGYTRIEAVNVLIVRMTAVKTTMRTLKAMHKITAQQEVQYLDLLNSVSVQVNAWQSKIGKESKPATANNADSNKN